MPGIRGPPRLAVVVRVVADENAPDFPRCPIEDAHPGAGSGGEVGEDHSGKTDPASIRRGGDVKGIGDPILTGLKEVQAMALPIPRLIMLTTVRIAAIFFIFLPPKS